MAGTKNAVPVTYIYSPMITLASLIKTNVTHNQSYMMPINLR